MGFSSAQKPSFQPQKSSVLPRNPVSNPKSIQFCPETQFPAPKAFSSAQKQRFQLQKHSVLPRSSASSPKRVQFCPEAALPTPKEFFSAQPRVIQTANNFLECGNYCFFSRNGIAEVQQTLGRGTRHSHSKYFTQIPRIFTKSKLKKKSTNSSNL